MPIPKQAIWAYGLTITENAERFNVDLSVKAIQLAFKDNIQQIIVAREYGERLGGLHWHMLVEFSRSPERVSNSEWRDYLGLQRDPGVTWVRMGQSTHEFVRKWSHYIEEDGDYAIFN